MTTVQDNSILNMMRFPGAAGQGGPAQGNSIMQHLQDPMFRYLMDASAGAAMASNEGYGPLQQLGFGLNNAAGNYDARSTQATKNAMASAQLQTELLTAKKLQKEITATGGGISGTGFDQNRARGLVPQIMATYAQAGQPITIPMAETIAMNEVAKAKLTTDPYGNTRTGQAIGGYGIPTLNAATPPPAPQGQGGGIINAPTPMALPTGGQTPIPGAFVDQRAVRSPDVMKGFATKRQEKDIARVDKLRDEADTAEATSGDINFMRAILSQTDYTGFGGEQVKDAKVFFGGGEAEQTVSSKATELQLSFTEKTKGAISDKEMALFAIATPGLKNRPGANKMILDGMELGAQRAIQKSLFNERWLNSYGNLTGAAQAWKNFTDNNPVIDGDASNPEGWTFNIKNLDNWESYLDKNRKASPSDGVTSSDARRELKNRGIIQ